MINGEQRAIAARIAKGCPVSELSGPVLPKVETTGHFAEMLAGISFDVIRQQLADDKSTTSRGLVRVLASSMFAQASAVTRGHAHASRMDELLAERAVRVNSRVPANPLGSNVRQGSDTGVTSVATTLDTLIIRTRRGEPLTRRGLHESQRMPFALAMLPIKALRPTYDKVTRDTSRMEQDVYGIGRTVIMDSVCAMTPRQGLALKPEYTTVTSPVEDPENPHLGCPVTLIDRFVRDVFSLVADEAVEKRLISLTD